MPITQFPVVQSRPKIFRLPKMSAIRLLGRVRKADRNKSREIAVVKEKRIATPKTLTGWSAFQIRTRNKVNKNRHTVHLFSPDRVIGKDSLVVVNCDCGRMVFTYEVANAEREGASFIYRSNGDRPETRNPAMRVGLCGHAYLALRSMVQRNEPNL